MTTVVFIIGEVDVAAYYGEEKRWRVVTDQGGVYGVFSSQEEALLCLVLDCADEYGWYVEEVPELEE